jgi:hypothetical protein
MEHITPEDFTTMRQQVTEMYTALIGNPISKDGGMVKRLTDVEAKVSKMDKFTSRIGWQVGLLWASGGVIVTGLMAIIFKK